MAMEGTGGGGPTFKQVVAIDNAIAAKLKESGAAAADPHLAQVAERNAQTDVVTTEGFTLANVGKDQNDVNIVVAGFNQKDHDDMYSEQEFELMQQMLNDPQQLNEYERMVTEIYQQDKILSADGGPEANKPDGAGMGVWTKRAFELQNQGLTPAQVQEALKVEINAARANPAGAPPQPDPARPAGPY